MNLSITARHFELTDELKDFTQKKFQKLEHYNHLITKTDVILGNDASQKFAEGKINVRGSFITAKTNANDIYLAIGLLADKLVKQMGTYDGKLKGKKRLSRSP